METWNQELQCHKPSLNSFEGWYFRISDNKCSIAIIVGISYDKEDPHCFIQTLDTISKKSQYIRYQNEEFLCDKDRFYIRIEDNIFSEHGVILHLEEKEVKIQGALAFQNLTKLEGTKYAPTIMGPFAYLKHMECVHAIISAHHNVYGSLRIQGNEMLIHGNGYIEKDRGISFPKEYIWIQSNECEEGKATLFLAIAHIPLYFIKFQGTIAFIQIADKQYRFGTYYGARANVVKNSDEELVIRMKQGKWQLDIQLKKNERYPLLAPKSGKMGPKVFEGLQGKAIVRLAHGTTCIATLHFNHCGNEVRCNTKKDAL